MFGQDKTRSSYFIKDEKTEKVLRHLQPSKNAYDEKFNNWINEQSEVVNSNDTYNDSTATSTQVRH